MMKRPIQKSVRTHRHGTEFTDDGTLTYIFRSHTLLILIGVLAILTYFAVFEDNSSHENDWEHNSKRGITACILVFLVFGTTQARDGPFIRPHPAIWRLVMTSNVVYFLFMIFLLFQSATNARNLMKFFDPEIGEPLDFQSYGHDCAIYDPVSFPDNPYHNFWLKMDGFVVAHLVGWICKTLMIRDFWLTNVISVLFELCEYSLEHQLKNFSECWWDHWILDFLICNLGGIILGMQVIKWLKSKDYDWVGLASQKTSSDKATRVVAQFTPHSWVTFHWNLTSMKNIAVIFCVIILYLLTEINTFYLKYVLWIPAGHRIILIRLWLFVFWGAPATREIYDYMIGEAIHIGQQFWLFFGTLVCECLVIWKFGKEVLVIPPERHIILAWGWGVGLVALYCIWRTQFSATNVTPGSEEEQNAVHSGELDTTAKYPKVKIYTPDPDNNNNRKLRKRK